MSWQGLQVSGFPAKGIILASTQELEVMMGDHSSLMIKKVFRQFLNSSANFLMKWQSYLPLENISDKVPYLRLMTCLPGWCIWTNEKWTEDVMYEERKQDVKQL